MKPKRELLRVVRSPEGEISLDLTGKKNGRGAYVCPSESCFARAVKQKQLERQLGVPISEEVRSAIQAQIASYTREARHDEQK